jgi:hypothetical protein
MKYVQAVAYTPQGALVNVHRLAGAQVSGREVTLILNSFVEATSELPTWQDQYPMPFDEFTARSYPEGVLEWLVEPDGLFPTGTLVEDPATPLAKAKAECFAALANRRDKAIHGGYTFQEIGRFDTDTRSLSNIQGAVQAAAIALSASQNPTRNWRLADNTTAPITAGELVSLGLELVEFVNDCYEHSWALKADIEAAEEVADAYSVNIQAGWPVSQSPVVEEETPTPSLPE